MWVLAGDWVLIGSNYTCAFRPPDPRSHSYHQPLDLVLEARPAGTSPLAAIILA